MNLNLDLLEIGSGIKVLAEYLNPDQKVVYIENKFRKLKEGQVSQDFFRFSGNPPHENKNRSDAIAKWCGYGFYFRVSAVPRKNFHAIPYFLFLENHNVGMYHQDAGSKKAFRLTRDLMIFILAAEGVEITKTKSIFKLEEDSLFEEIVNQFTDIVSNEFQTIKLASGYLVPVREFRTNKKIIPYLFMCGHKDKFKKVFTQKLEYQTTECPKKTTEQIVAEEMAKVDYHWDDLHYLAKDQTPPRLLKEQEEKKESAYDFKPKGDSFDLKKVKRAYKEYVQLKEELEQLNSSTYSEDDEDDSDYETKDNKHELNSKLEELEFKIKDYLYEFEVFWGVEGYEDIKFDFQNTREWRGAKAQAETDRILEAKNDSSITITPMAEAPKMKALEVEDIKESKIEIDDIKKESKKQKLLNFIRNEFFKTEDGFSKRLFLRNLLGPTGIKWNDPALKNMLSGTEFIFNYSSNKEYQLHKIHDWFSAQTQKTKTVKVFNGEGVSEMALRSLADSIQEKPVIALVQGAAGTGKSELLIKLTSVLNKKAAVASPTAAAAQMLKKRNILVTPKTAHSLLFTNKRFSSKIRSRYFGSVKREIPFSTIIIDECSMIPAYCWYELMKFSQSGVSLVFFGDSRQLGPVNSSFNIFEQKAFTHIYNLTYFHRFVEGSLALKLAKDFNAYKKEIPTISRGEIVEIFAKDKNKGPALFYSNEAVNNFNCLIRKEKNIKDVTPIPGEPLLVKKNCSHDQTFKNGLAITVEKTKQFTTLNRGKYEIKAVHSLVNGKWVWLCFDNIPTKFQGITFQRLESKVFSETGCNIVFVKFGYARTVHSVQGSEFDHVYIDKQSIPKNERMFYTAVTRSKNNVNLF
jgi:hypothetical protein